MRTTVINLLIFGIWLSLHTQAFGQVGNISDGVRVAWDYSSLQQLAERGGYPRLTRLKDSTLVVVYETRTGNVHLKRSIDNGLTWSDPEEVFSKFVYAALDGKSTIVNIANPEIKQLKNGDIVIACNYRPARAEIAPYSIVIRRSTDNGKTWQVPQNLYTAAPRFGDGCWEPSFLQLPNGELQVYFANESPYRKSDEQEISMLSSQDGGITWTTKPKTVSFRKDRRDGMPVAQLIGNKIVLIIEDNNIDKFKPYTVRTSIEDNWSEPVLANSSNREYSLVEYISDTVYMGAPYLLKLPNGETLISYQTNENRSNNWELSTMEVAIGNKDARKFNRRTQPFNVPLNKEAKWNSIALWDNHTVVALASSNFDSKEIAPWLVKGHIIPALDLKQEKVRNYPIFIGSLGKTNLKGGIGADDEHIYIECVVSENLKKPFELDSSGVFLFLKLNEQIYKIWSSKTGDKQVWSKKGNAWKALSGVNEIAVSASNTNDFYKIKFIVSKDVVNRKLLKDMSLGLALSAYDSSDKRYTEYLTNMEIDVPETWLKVEL